MQPHGRLRCYGDLCLHASVVSPIFPCISSTRCTPVSSWNNRPLLSGGDSSCSWVFYSCAGPKGWILTLQEGCQLGSTCVSHTMLYLEYPPEYSCKRTQTSSFSCKVYWETGTGSWSGVTAIQWNTTHKSKHCIVDTHAIAIHSYKKQGRNLGRKTLNTSNSISVYWEFLYIFTIE